MANATRSEPTCPIQLAKAWESNPRPSSVRTTSCSEGSKTASIASASLLGVESFTSTI